MRTLRNVLVGATALALTATGVVLATQATAATPTFDFGAVAAYDTSAPKTVTLTGGDTPVTFGTGSISGANPDIFKITADDCSGKTLTNGQTCSVTAVARPTEAGVQPAEFVLPDDSAAGATRIPLTVTGYVSDKGTFYNVAPKRIMDTRTGTGVRKGTVGPGGVLTLQVTGTAGIPANASTVVLNVTVTGSTKGGYVTVYPAGATRPTASSLNFAAGWRGANSVTVKLGTGGKVSFYNTSTGVNIIADVSGYYSAGHQCCTSEMGGQYHPLTTPLRLTDTRQWGIGRIPGGHFINSVVGGSDPDTLSKIRAFAVNITATSPSATGYLTAWNGNGVVPSTSTLNYLTATTVPNFAVVPTTPCENCAEATGLPSIGVYTSSASHIIVDLVGYYDDGSLPGGLRFSPLVPTRIADTRIGQGAPTKIGPAGTATIVAPSSVTTEDTWALALNVTAVRPTVNTYLIVWPVGFDGVPRPATSNLNPLAGSTVPNAVQTMVGPDFAFGVYNYKGSVDVVVDVVGTFNMYPPEPPAASSNGLRAPTLKTKSAATLKAVPTTRIK